MGWDLTALILLRPDVQTGTAAALPRRPEVMKAGRCLRPLLSTHAAPPGGPAKTDFKIPGQGGLPGLLPSAVQNIGPKTKEVLAWSPAPRVEVIERCSGHDGTLCREREFHASTAMKIVQPVVGASAAGADHTAATAPWPVSPHRPTPADGRQPEHPMTLLRQGLRPLIEEARCLPSRRSLQAWGTTQKSRELSRGGHGTRPNAVSPWAPMPRLYFRIALTVKYQVQEMLRIERIFERAPSRRNWRSYSPLIPDGQNWKATFMIEFSDPDERRMALTRMVGIEDTVWLGVSGHPPVQHRQ